MELQQVVPEEITIIQEAVLTIMKHASGIIYLRHGNTTLYQTTGYSYKAWKMQQVRIPYPYYVSEVLLQCYNFDINLTNFLFLLADSCLVSYNNDLFLIGGSRSWYRYADEPSKVWVLFNENGGSQSWRDDIIPPLMGSRMWHGCSIATLNRKVITISIQNILTSIAHLKD